MTIISLMHLTDTSETVAAAGPRGFVYHSADAIQAANRNTNKAYI